jgi:hypothetical protein
MRIYHALPNHTHRPLNTERFSNCEVKRFDGSRHGKPRYLHSCPSAIVNVFAELITASSGPAVEWMTEKYVQCQEAPRSNVRDRGNQTTVRDNGSPRNEVLRGDVQPPGEWILYEFHLLQRTK